MKTVAIIPAKSVSNRVPGKNMRLFNGKPLLSYTIQAALKSALVDEVYVSTDDPEIKKYAEQEGAKVPFLRPQDQSGTEVHSSVPVLDLLEKIGGAEKYDYCLKLLPTSPVRGEATIDAVIKLSQKNKKNVLTVADLGCTVNHLRTLSENGLLNNVAADTVYNFQTQDAPSLFYLVGTAQCAPVEALLKNKTFQYGQPMGYPVNKFEAVDIDTEEDFIYAEKLARLSEKN